MESAQGFDELMACAAKYPDTAATPAGAGGVAPRPPPPPFLLPSFVLCWSCFTLRVG